MHIHLAASDKSVEVLKKSLALWVFLLLLMPHTHAQKQQFGTVRIQDESSFLLIGKYIEYFEDKTGQLTRKEIQSESIQSKFKKWNKPVFARPATSSAYWFRFSASNNCPEDLWLEVSSTYAWYLNFYTTDSLGNIKLVRKTGAMLPHSTKFYDSNYYWFPLNKRYENEPQQFYLRVTTSISFEFPLHVGTIRSLSASRDDSMLIHGIFLGIAIIMFLYNLFLYFSTKDHAYFWYLGYLFFIALNVPYSNGFPFILDIEVLGIDRVWWNNNFLFWNTPIYFFMGMFCIVYLDLKNTFPLGYRIVIVEIVSVTLLPIALYVFGTELSAINNPLQMGIMLESLTCLLIAYYLLLKGNRFATYYSLGWTFMFSLVFIFFGTVNGTLPYNMFTRNAVYWGVALEVWMFSLALGDRINRVQQEKKKTQKKYLELVEAQKKILQAEVDERTEELQSTLEEIEAINGELLKRTDQLAEINATKDRLFSVIGHDLISPMSSIRTLLDLSLHSDLSQNKFKEFAKGFYYKVEDLEFMLRNLLHWANTQKNGIVTLSRDVLLHEVAERNIDLLADKAENKQITLENKIKEGISAWADEDQLNIIVLNLLNNALKFTSEEGTITLRANEIDEKTVRISVSDTGIGMDDATLKKLFANPNSTKGTNGEKGNGLGLSICYDFVLRNNGKIWAESEPGNGSVFYFTLPRTRDREQ